jgi:Tfp pilus assembly protein PilN
MKVINFLPDDYVERQGRRRANVICLVLGGVSILMIGAVVGYHFVSMLGLASMRALVEQQYVEATQQIEQLKQLEERKTGLMRKVDLSTTLLERVPRSHLLARLVNYLPTNTSLMSLTMKMEEADVKVADAPAAAAAAAADEKANPAAAKKGAANKGKADTIRIKRLVFRVDGLAPTDVEVAAYISRLSADPLLREVDLQFSEEFPYKDTLQMRRFQLCFRLNPEAEKIMESGAAGSVAKAPPAPKNVRGES